MAFLRLTCCTCDTVSRDEEQHNTITEEGKLGSVSIVAAPNIFEDVVLRGEQAPSTPAKNPSSVERPVSGTGFAQESAALPTSPTSAPAAAEPKALGPETSYLSNGGEDVVIVKTKSRELNSLRKHLPEWRLLEGPPADLEGERILVCAGYLPEVYPCVFRLPYATKYLSNDLKDHVSYMHKNWPKGAKSMREVVQAEIASMGVSKIGKKYWSTCTVRLMWIVRTMLMFEYIMSALLKNDTQHPSEIAKLAVANVVGPNLNWTLTKVAGYIASYCVWPTQDKLYKALGETKEGSQTLLQELVIELQRIAFPLNDLLRQEVPTVWAMKAA